MQEEDATDIQIQGVGLIMLPFASMSSTKAKRTPLFLPATRLNAEEEFTTESYGYW